jgi:ubiquinone biosynthesis protein COQ9
MTATEKSRLLNAILPHVPFDGWAARAFDAAVAETGIDAARARAICPRGAVDLAVAQHKAGDAALAGLMRQTNLAGLRYSEKVARALRLRLDAAGDKEVVRRAAALFALPHLAPEGATLVWGTADAVWTALGDTSDDINWYSKRAILSGVWGSVLLFWLGDQSPGEQATADFIDRRIADVMRFEKLKAQVADNPLTRPLAGPLGRLAAAIRAPGRRMPADLPGHWTPTDG